jgi:glutathione synthase/RimK-type ligase-like ATP-grasp enzyme
MLRLAYQEGIGDRFIRLNTEDVATNIDATFSQGHFELHIRDSGRTLFSDELLSVWYRRPEEIRAPHGSESEPGDFIVQQWTAFLRGFYMATLDTARWVSPLPALHRSRYKLAQLKLARELGFTTPETLSTNVPDEAVAFADRHQEICVKSLDEPLFRLNGTLHPWLTTRVSAEHVRQHMEAVRHCPVLFQQYIAKACDIRVTCVGPQVFAFAIYSQSREESANDFRGVAPDQLRHEVHNLPKKLEARLLEYMRREGLLFSAFDLVLTPDGEYVFIENNPNGQWLWLEHATGIRISEALLRLLTNEA